MHPAAGVVCSCEYFFRQGVIYVAVTHTQYPVNQSSAPTPHTASHHLQPVAVPHQSMIVHVLKVRDSHPFHVSNDAISIAMCMQAYAINHAPMEGTALDQILVNALMTGKELTVNNV